MKITKILAGIDFEKDTEKVLAYASYFAENFNACLDLLHVLDYLVTPPAYLLPYIEEEKKIVGQKFAALKKELAGSGIRAEAEVIAGRLRESFDMTIKNQNTDMLVLGFMSHVLRRSSSEKLIKGLRIPMLVVRGDKAESAKIGSLKVRKILCTTDFSEISGKALNAAKELAVKLSSQLEIVHVFPNHIFEQMKTLKDRDGLLKELYNESKDRLEKFLHASGLTVAGTMEEGEPDRRIVSFAKQNDFDLIVIGARGLGRIEGMLIGSVTDAVLKSAPCPVLVIH
jgi:nucleotide-binding universal stress UspA family protein